MIKYEKGNVFDHLRGPCIFVHGCNAQRTMGSGVAKIVRSDFPELYITYLEMEQKLGEVSCVNFNGTIMCNLISQRNYGYEGKIYVNYDALHMGLVQIGTMAKILNLPIKMPFIGAGLGGGAKQDLKEVFESALFGLDVTVFSLEN